MASHRRSVCPVDACGDRTKVLWEMMMEGNADQDGDNRISEDEFVRPGSFESEHFLRFSALGSRAI